MESSKFRTIGYWTATGVVALGFGFGALADLSASTEVMVSLSRLGYPGYLAAILGIWKALGVAAILAPRFERLKEWAYAGMFFDLTGAAVSHAVAGDPLGKAVMPMVVLGFVMASWALRPSSRRLASGADRRLASGANQGLASGAAPESARDFSSSGALARS